ncbi:AAA family ATPase [Pseudoxanthobacter sp. M-2]|uniref:ATP-binding protein n=1 Tax=Pseudoxanthobacter sp. M-2 TaxID=3078754 RepID=UPI0038FCCB0D
MTLRNRYSVYEGDGKIPHSPSNDEADVSQILATRSKITSGSRDGMNQPPVLPPNFDTDEMGAARGSSAANEDRSQVVPEGRENTAKTRPGLLDRFIWHGEALPEPPPQLIKHTLPRDGVVLLGGQSGAGKTFTVCHLAVCLATGVDFFGRRVKERVGVAILAAEGAATLPMRLKVAGDEIAYGGKLPITHASVTIDLMKPSDERSVIQQLLEISAEMERRFQVRLGAVIIDAVAASFGFKDENSNSEVTKATNALYRIANAVGALVIGVHHYGKDQSTGLRGGSAWRGNVDGVLATIADRDHTSGIVGQRQLILEKNRTGPEGPIAPFSLKFIKTGVDEDGEDEGACIVVPDLTTPPVMTVPKSALGNPMGAKAGLPKRASGQRPEAFRQAFNEALISHGETRAIQGDGPRVKMVSLTKVRDAFWRFYVTGGEPNPKKQESARRAAWSAMQKDLVKSEFYAGSWDGQEWIWAKD